MVPVLAPVKRHVLDSGFQSPFSQSLAHDLGQKLGCGAHLTRLRRVASGRFDVADAAPLSEILQWDLPALEKRLIPFLRLKSYE